MDIKKQDLSSMGVCDIKKQDLSGMGACDCCLHILRLLIVLNERIHHLFSLAQVVRITVLMSEVAFL